MEQATERIKLMGIIFMAMFSSAQISSSNFSNDISTYLDWLLLSRENVTQVVNLVENLALLHCNIYCNGTSKTTIVSRDCRMPTPVCRQCHCDDDCQTYGDCCPDENGEVLTHLQTTYECVSSEENSYYLWGVHGSYFMITSCPDGADIEVSSSRGASRDVSPVTSVTSNATYINGYTATCHDDTNYRDWKKEHVCMSKKTTNPQQKDCVAFIYPPYDLPVRSCNAHMTNPKNTTYIDTCNATGLWDEWTFDSDVDEKCKDWYYYPVAGGGYVFKNIYCFLCNGLTPTVLQCGRMFGSSYSINDLIRMSTDLDKPVCKEYEWYDKLKNVCRYMSCREGYKLQGEECVMTSVSLPNIQYDLTVEFWSSGSHQSQLRSWSDVETIVVQKLPEILTSNNISDYVFTVFNLSHTDRKNSSKLKPSFCLSLTFRTNQNCCRTDFELKMSQMLKGPWTFMYNSTEYRFNVSSDINDDLRVTDSETYIVTSGSNPRKISMYGSLSDYIGGAEEYISLPHTYPKCSFVSLYGGEFEWNSITSITLTYADLTIPSENFTQLHEGQLVICIEMLRKLYKNYEFPPDPLKQAENIVSLFFSILSLICLAMTFVTYCTFPSLLTLPTKNTMCLVVFLFVAQLLLQFGNLASRDETSCKVIGVLIHYSWLCVIFWMNVCSYHMFHVFVIEATKPISTQSHRSRPLVYFLYANGLSLTIVVITMVANLGTTAGSQIGYGNGVCYLSTALLTGVSFVLPLGIILILNITFFSISVWTMAKINKMSQCLGKDKSQVHIYMKLSTLTGIFWILSILAENLQLQILVFISVILNASQGVFIFISYMANRRIYQLWKGKVMTPKEINQNSNHTESTHL